jgi:tetratricopeptide (TPR) repeat protein
MRTNKILLSAVLLIAVAGIIFQAVRLHTSPAPAAAQSVAAPTPATTAARSQGAEQAPAATSASVHDEDNNNAAPPSIAAAAAPAAEAKSAADEVFDQSLDLLVSPQASLQQKQAVWNQLRNTGQLGHAIAALEERQQADPTSAEIPTQLGMAYLLNISATSDVREQGIGGMKADMSFDAALKLDPTNWEAQFFKASALTHWPDSMNTGPQVIQRFTTLIQQQEAQPPRPEFVQSYVLLGDQYQKSGQPDAARQAWGRGLSLFPTSQTLSQRLNPAP